jgi:hypothetical protein
VTQPLTLGVTKRRARGESLFCLSCRMNARHPTRKPLTSSPNIFEHPPEKFLTLSDVFYFRDWKAYIRKKRRTELSIYQLRTHLNHWTMELMVLDVPHEAEDEILKGLLSFIRTFSGVDQECEPPRGQLLLRPGLAGLCRGECAVRTHRLR